MLRRLLRLACVAVLSVLARGGARADPALWMARSPTATVYLFGTVHLLPKAQSGAWMTQAVSRALAASQELWTEADIGNLSGSIAAIRRYGLAEGPGAASLLPRAYRDRFERLVGQAGLPAVLVAHARPWLAELLLDGASMAQAGPLVPGVEARLLAYARDHHMATPAFETLDQQFALLAGMPLQAQLVSLEQQIDGTDHAAPLFAALLAAWRAGDTTTLDRLTNQDMRAHDKAAWTTLILHRNERFAASIGARLQSRGTAFVAVGAAHLAGASSVEAMLTQAGFAVTRVQ